MAHVIKYKAEKMVKNECIDRYFMLDSKETLKETSAKILSNQGRKMQCLIRNRMN